ncbi:MAG TPA: riboflavin synthase [Longimicrobiales bacterium]|nr:riboflavin synthase [Longimicrobiales bacterium]
MFSGIVEEVGLVDSAEPMGDGVRIRVSAARVLEGLALGDSIAIDGVCQTVVAFDDSGFEVQAIPTTLARTTLGEWRQGRRVNLERALAFGSRVGGHLVQGHVDGVAEIIARDQHDEHTILTLSVPPEVGDVTVLHGSITVNGVSLTVHRLPARDEVQVALIPFTLEHTNLADLRPGDRVNVEGDMLGRFVIHHLQRRRAGDATAR